MRRDHLHPDAGMPEIAAAISPDRTARASIVSRTDIASARRRPTTSPHTAPGAGRLRAVPREPTLEPANLLNMGEAGRVEESRVRGGPMSRDGGDEPQPWRVISLIAGGAVSVPVVVGFVA